jgi:hypothetical protein
MILRKLFVNDIDVIKRGILLARIVHFIKMQDWFIYKGILEKSIWSELFMFSMLYGKRNAEDAWKLFNKRHVLLSEKYV